jgi:hypothetical protein
MNNRVNIYDKTDYFQDYLNEHGVNLAKEISIDSNYLSIAPFDDFKKFAAKYTPVVKAQTPKPYYQVENGGLQNSVFTYHLGYDEKNTIEHNYGNTEEQNDELKQLFGQHNLLKLNLDYSTALLRLLVYYPGHGIPMHTDTFNSYKSYFNLPKDTEIELKRYFVAISPWDWGHMLQVHNNVITHWKEGDTYEIPENTYHLSCNFGIAPKYSLTLTGQKMKVL